MADLMPYAYSPYATPLHRVDAGLKLAILCLLSFLAFIAGPVGIVVSGAAVGAAAIVSRTNAKKIFSGSRALLISTGIIVAIKTFTVRASAPFIAIDATGFREGVLFFASLMVSFAGGAVLFATTTSFQLRSALRKGERALLHAIRRIGNPKTVGPRARRPASDISLLLALILAFLPRVFEVWEATVEARAVRCGKMGIRGIFSVVPLVLERMIEAAAETSLALEARGYSPLD